jgi:hypothetical protein
MPPMMQIMKDIGGVELPEFIAKLTPESAPQAEKAKVAEPAAATSVAAAKKLLRDPTFEGDSVRVITRDGELVWNSREGDISESKRRHRPVSHARRRR